MAAAPKRYSYVTEAKAHVKALLIAQIIAAVNRAANYVREPFSSHTTPPTNDTHS